MKLIIDTQEHNLRDKAADNTKRGKTKNHEDLCACTKLLQLKFKGRTRYLFNVEVSLCLCLAS